MLPPTDLDGLSHADLKSLVLKLLEEAAELRRTVAAQRDEIARLKGGPGRPNIKPSGMDKATEPRPPPPTGSEPRQKGGKTSKLSIHEERTVTVAAPPQGSRFKGYTNFVVQDLVIRSHVVNFRRERWQKPDGDMMTAPLPAGISGHFGPELRRFVLAQYHQGQMTVPRLLAQLRAFGIVISKRQLVRLLIAGQDGFLAENREVCAPGSRAPPGSRSMIPVLATRPRMASARRSATHTLSGLAPRLRRAASRRASNQTGAPADDPHLRAHHRATRGAVGRVRPRDAGVADPGRTHEDANTAYRAPIVRGAKLVAV